VVRSLRILEGQLRPGVLKRTLQATAEDVEGGTPLSEALGKSPRIFDNLYTNMVRAGEAGGIQDEVLKRLAAFMEQSERIKSKVKGALAYPVVVIVIAAIVIIVVMTFVVPRFKEIFKQLLGEDLPPLTQRLMDLSELVRDTWWLWGVGIPLGYVLHRVLVGRLLGYRRFRDRVLLRLPLFGALIRKTIVARFARTFGTLIQSGVPHLEALEILKASIRNRVLEEAVDGILGSIREGEGIARPMGESGIFDDIIVNMVEVGEQTGELDRMLLRIADRYEVEVDRTIEVVFKAIEPILLVVLAVFVGLIVFALLQPMLRLMGRIGKR
jgi:type IV pilus assembly protein PilC